MNKQRTQQQLYIFFWIVIVLLLGLIGWFTYVLIKPSNTTNTNTTNQTTNDIKQNSETNSNKKTKKNNNANVAATNENTNTENANVDTETNTNSDATNTNTNTTTNDEGGLVEPSNTNTNSNTNESTDATTDDANKKTVTLYFPKTAAACGEVSAVERKIEPTDDIYGQIILEDMSGPTAEETGYTSAIPGGMYLRRVEYTAAGALITVSEAYDNLDSCAQQTVSAQLIKTANAMFDLPEDTAGEVVVGTVTDDESTNSNTNTDDTSASETTPTE